MAVRWVASKVNRTVAVRPWKLLSAAAGSEVVIFRLSEAFAFREARLLSGTADPMMRVLSSTVLAVPPQVSAPSATAVQATLQDSILSCRPLVASVVRAFAVAPEGSAVVSVTVLKSELPAALLSVANFSTESPGRRPVTVVVSVPLARLMSVVPAVTCWSAVVVLSVKPPYVPRPATAAAVPRSAAEARTLPAVVLS